jgi:phosphonate transport system substrate-binding protein
MGKMAIRCGVLARRAVLTGVALAMSGALGGFARADTPQSLRFALIAPQSRQEMEASWAPVLSALSRHLGVPVEMDVSSDYAGAIWNLRSGHAHFAWLGNKSAIEAVDNAGVEVFARETYPSGLGGYYSYLIVPKGSSLTSAEEVLAQAPALTLGHGDANSTSGTVVPTYYLFSLRRLEPRKIFKRVIQANHEDNIRAVAEARTDVATVASIIYDQMARRNPEITGAVRIIWRSPLIPADPLVWRTDLSSETKSKIAAFFLGFGAPAPGKSASALKQERAALDRLNIHSFIASDNRQLTSIRLVELSKTRMQTATDETLSKEERARRVRDIDGRMAEIERFSLSTAY